MVSSFETSRPKICRICVSHLPSACYVSCVSLAFDLLILLNLCWEFKLHSYSLRKFLHPCIYVCVCVCSYTVASERDGQLLLVLYAVHAYLPYILKSVVGEEMTGKIDGRFKSRGLAPNHCEMSWIVDLLIISTSLPVAMNTYKRYLVS
jgi:hypothetical protein